MKKGRSKMNQRGGGGSGAFKVVGLLFIFFLWLVVKGWRTQRIIDIFG